MKLSSKRRIVAVAGIVVLVLFLVRPGASRLKSRIAGSIGTAVGRPVEIGSVHIQLLPRPGFDLDNLVVYDDAVFGAEPMLRAPQVTAVLRLGALLHGRLEIARLDLTEPSLNLVHGENGRWNLEALLERAARIPLAPTAKTKSEPRPGFPYIEGSSARINFKTGQEKRPYALINADFALWQDSEDAWGVRLKAQPIRSDLNLSDTGTLQVNGTWKRAVTLRQTPLEFSLDWDRPQFGQLTKFFTGNDKGWRGAVQFEATLKGTPEHLHVSSSASIRDFRRYDITSGDSLRLSAHCDGEYSSLDHALHELFCRGPVGDGSITLHGDMGWPGSHKYGLVLMAENVPASAVAALTRRAKKGLPEDLSTRGNLDGSLSIRREGPASELQVLGSGQIASLKLVSARNKAELAPESVSMIVLSENSRNGIPRRHAKSTNEPNQVRIEFGPFPVAMGKTARAMAQGWVSRAGYSFSVGGEAEIARLLRTGRLFGLPALTTSADGLAQLDLQIAGSWADSAPGASEPHVTGTAKLHNVRAEVRGTNGPVEISSAELRLSSAGVRVTHLSARAAHTLWNGTLEMPRGCGTPDACVVRFNLSANEIALADLNQWASPHPKERPWYRALSAAPPSAPSFFSTLKASGIVAAKRLRLRQLGATHVSANVTLDRGKLRISALRADLLGGKHRGEWLADFSVKPPVYSGDGTLTGISLPQVADAMNDDWITGKGDATFQIKASGSSSADFWKSAEGALEFDLRDGMLPHISLVRGAEALPIERFQGNALLHNGQFAVHEAQLESSQGTFIVSGTASLSRELDFSLTRTSELSSESAGAQEYSILGTIAEPQVAPVTTAVVQAQSNRDGSPVTRPGVTVDSRK